VALEANVATLTNYRWLTWGVSRVHDGDLPPEVLVRIDAGRRRASKLTRVAGTIPITWVEDRSLKRRWRNHRCRIRDAWRKWSVIEFGRHVVHLDARGGCGSAPGFVFHDVRIFLDGRIVGRDWSAGCSLGSGGRVGPAAAMLRRDLALRMDKAMERLEVLRPEPMTSKPRRRLKREPCRAMSRRRR